MHVRRRTVNALLPGLPLAGAVPRAQAQAQAQAQVQANKKTLVLGMILEPNGLHPTTAAAAAFGEVERDDTFEGLTKIAVDGAVTPLLCESRLESPGGRSDTFLLKKGMTFGSAAVKDSFDRANAEGSANKAKKAVLDNMSSAAADATMPFRFINDPAALLVGDVDAMPRFGALQALKQFQGDKRFAVRIGSTEGKGILAINNRKAPFNGVRVRRALSQAIVRKACIDGAQDGLGTPIGSHFAPTDLGHVDLKKMDPSDPEKAKALLKEAGVTMPLNVTLPLPPPARARKGGEIVAAMLAKVGVSAKVENVERAQWLSGPFKGNVDLTVINHVEPRDDATAHTDPKCCFGYDSAKYRGLVDTFAATGNIKQKPRRWRGIQRRLAEDAVNVDIWDPAQVAVFRKGLRGVRNSSPIFASDLAAVSRTPSPVKV